MLLFAFFPPHLQLVYYMELLQAELLLVDTGKLQVWLARVGACLPVPREVLVSTA
jgi:hypothetical protein